MSTPQPNKGVIGITFLRYVLLALVIIGGAVVGYSLGNAIGVLIGTSQVYQGYSYGGMYQLYYNTTNVQQYQDLALIAPGLGITAASSLLQDFELIGLIMGLIGGIIGGLMIYRKIEEYTE